MAVLPPWRFILKKGFRWGAQGPQLRKFFRRRGMCAGWIARRAFYGR